MAEEISRPAAIERCVGQREAFLQQVWAKRPHHYRSADPSAYADVLSVGLLDELVATGGLRHPALRIVRDGQAVSRSVFLRSQTTGGKRITDAVDPEAALSCFADGATLVFQGLHRFVASVQRFCAELEQFFGHPLQANAYLTPASARGLGPHHDTHDVLVLQLFGGKRWTLYEPAVEHAVAGYPDGKRHPQPGEPAQVVELRAGDCLYVPRGVPHQAEGLDSASLHLALGIRSPTWIDVLERVMKRAREIPALRAPLPVAYATHPGRFESQLGKLLAQTADWLRRLDPVEVAAAEIERVNDTRAPERAGRLEALVRGEAVDMRTRFARAAVLDWNVAVRDDRAVLRAGATAIGFPARIAPALRAVEAADTVSAADLGEFLDAPGARVLLGRLWREGLLRRADG